MAFRKEKGSDPFSQKTNRFDRFAQMSKQEEMIQQKKREIQAKLEAQKRKDAEDNTKKLSTTNLNNKPGNKKPIGKPLSMRSIGSQLKSSATQSSSSSSSTAAAASASSSSQSSSSGALNIFSNDGSFMDQFRKLSGIKDSKHGGSKKEEFNLSQDDPPRERTEDREDQRRREREKDRIRDRERDRERDRSRERERDRDRENRERERDRDRCRERDRSRDRDVDRSRDHLRDRSHDRERDSYRARREDRWQGPSVADAPHAPHAPHAPRPSSPYSPTRVDFPPMFSTMYPPPNLSVPPPSSQPPFSQPPPSQPFISYPTSVPPRPPPQQANAHGASHPPPSQAVPSVPPPGAPPPMALQLLPQPSPLQHHSIPPPSALEQHLIPPPPMPPTGIPPPGLPGLPTLLPPRFQPPNHRNVPPPVPPPGVPPPGVPPPGVPPPGVPPPGVPPPGVRPPGVPPPGVPPPGVPPPGVPPPGVPPPTSVPPPVPAPSVRTAIPSGVPPPGLPRPPGMPPPGLPPGLPPGMPPGVPPPISHLTGVPPPSVVTSFSPLSVMPVPPPVVQPEVKPGEAPTGLSHPALHPTPSVITPVPPPLNGVISTAKKEVVCVNPIRGLEDDDAVLQLAKMVSQCGDDIEDIIKARNTDDAKLWFLHQKDSNAYIQYRQLVGRLRREAQRADDSDDEGETYPDREFQKKSFLKRNSPSYAKDNSHSHNENGQPSIVVAGPSQGGESENLAAARKRKRRSRWAPEDTKLNTPSIQLSSLPPTNVPPPGYQNVPLPALHGAGSGTGPPLSRVNRTDPGLLRYAMQTFGTTNLSEDDWKKAEDHYKINLLYQDLLKKREEIKKLESKGKHKYEYDSDEECEGGTWEHKLRSAEMEATERWADELTRQSQGKHHIGDFLPPEELSKFMEKYSALKEDREPDLSDYKDFKLKEDNIGFQMLQKLGWSEGQGLGSDGSGIVDPIGRANQRSENQGLGVDRPDEVSKEDDEFDAYRKRMMLAYRFRPNPLNNPRRPYY